MTRQGTEKTQISRSMLQGSMAGKAGMTTYMYSVWFHRKVTSIQNGCPGTASDLNVLLRSLLLLLGCITWISKAQGVQSLAHTWAQETPRL